MVQVSAGLLKLHPLSRISQQGVPKQGAVQTLELAADFAGHLKSFNLGGGEFGFYLLDPLPRRNKPVNRAARHQKECDQQQP